MKLPDNDTHFKNAKHYQRGALFQALAFVRKWDCAIDVGAHVGFITKDLAGLFEMVHAFEPQPDNYACLKENVPSNVSCNRVALGDSWKKGRMDTPLESNSGAWQFVAADIGANVEMYCLDDYGLAPDFIKIDVQAMEYEVMLGASRTIREHKPVLLVETQMDNVRDDRIGKLAAEMGFQMAVTIGKNTAFLWQRQLAEAR